MIAAEARYREEHEALAAWPPACSSRSPARTTADGRDRKQLERICRYLLRPPFAHDAVTALLGDRRPRPRLLQGALAQRHRPH